MLLVPLSTSNANDYKTTTYKGCVSIQCIGHLRKSITFSHPRTTITHPQFIELTPRSCNCFYSDGDVLSIVVGITITHFGFCDLLL